MEKWLKLPGSIPQARGSCLEKQNMSTQRAARAGTAGWEKARLHTVRDIQQLYPLWGALGFVFPSSLGVSGILDCQYLVYFGIFTLVQGQHGVSPLGWAGKALPFPFYSFKRLKQLRAPWFNEVSSNLTPKSLKTSLSTAVPPISTITWKPGRFPSSPDDGCVYTSFRSHQDNQLNLVTWLRFNETWFESSPWRCLLWDAGWDFSHQGELQPGRSSCHGIVPGSTSSIPSSAHTPCPAQPFPAPARQEGTPPWEWDLLDKISNVPLGMCELRKSARLKMGKWEALHFSTLSRGRLEGIGFAGGEQRSGLKAIPKAVQAVSNHWEIGQILKIFRGSRNVDGQQQWMAAAKGRENNYLHSSRHIFVQFCVNLFVFQKKMLLQQNQQGQLENVDFTD